MSIIPSRRGLIKGLISLVAAPTIVPYGSLMPVKKVIAAPLVIPRPVPFIGELWYDHMDHRLKMWTGERWEVPNGKCMVSPEIEQRPYVDENFRPGTVGQYSMRPIIGPTDPYGTDYVSDNPRAGVTSWKDGDEVEMIYYG